MTGGTIVVGERELSVPDSCQENHVDKAREAIERGLAIRRGTGDGNAAEDCRVCNYSIVVQFENGQPKEIIRSTNKWR